MKNKRKNNNIVKVALVVSLLVVSVGFAVLSTSLNITGTTSINSSGWSVKFKTDTISVTSGSVSATTPTVTGDTTLAFSPTLATPGDFYEFTIDVKNEGTINAKITSITPISLTVAQQKYATCTVTYSDNTAIAQNDKLAAGASKKIKVRVEYKTDITSSDLPSENQTLNLTYGLTYGQD